MPRMGTGHHRRCRSWQHRCGLQKGRARAAAGQGKQERRGHGREKNGRSCRRQEWRIRFVMLSSSSARSSAALVVERVAVRRRSPMASAPPQIGGGRPAPPRIGEARGRVVAGRRSGRRRAAVGGRWSRRGGRCATAVGGRHHPAAAPPSCLLARTPRPSAVHNRAPPRRSTMWPVRRSSGEGGAPPGE